VAFSNQTLEYRILAEALLDHLWNIGQLKARTRLAGMVYDILQKPTIKFCGKDANFEAYLNRVQAWYQDRQEKSPDDPPHIHRRVRFSGPRISEEFWVKLVSADRYARGRLEVTRYPKHESSCMDRYGGTCPFLGMCSTSPIQWPAKIITEFDQRDPEQYEDEEGIEPLFLDAAKLWADEAPRDPRAKKTPDTPGSRNRLSRTEPTTDE
jgi:hypothetical protein